jgi:hypothetical protein
MAKGTKRLRDYETTDNRQVKAKSKSPTPKAFAIRQVVAALCKNRHKECPSGVE